MPENLFYMVFTCHMYHVTFKHVIHYLNAFSDSVAIEADVTDLHGFVCYFLCQKKNKKNFIMLESLL